MLDWMFIILLIMAIIFMILALEHYKDKFWSVIFTLIDTVIWFILAASVLEIERGWQMYNASSGQIETGIHIISSKVSPELVYFFMMFGAIMMIYGIGYILGPLIYETHFKKKWKTR